MIAGTFTPPMIAGTFTPVFIDCVSVMNEWMDLDAT